jgi:putative Ca2+/H+ antiporter (TMEM165/GDT1 family)
MTDGMCRCFAGALGALALMTLLSAAAGFALPNLIPRTYTHYASVVLFFVFGFKLLKDAHEMADGGGPSEELEEVEAELNMADKKKNPDLESGEKLGSRHPVPSGFCQSSNPDKRSNCAPDFIVLAYM